MFSRPWCAGLIVLLSLCSITNAQDPTKFPTTLLYTGGSAASSPATVVDAQKRPSSCEGSPGRGQPAQRPPKHKRRHRQRPTPSSRGCQECERPSRGRKGWVAGDRRRPKGRGTSAAAELASLPVLPAQAALQGEPRVDTVKTGGHRNGDPRPEKITSSWIRRERPPDDVVRLQTPGDSAGFQVLDGSVLPVVYSREKVLVHIDCLDPTSTVSITTNDVAFPSKVQTSAG